MSMQSSPPAAATDGVGSTPQHASADVSSARYSDDESPPSIVSDESHLSVRQQGAGRSFRASSCLRGCGMSIQERARDTANCPGGTNLS